MTDTTPAFMGADNGGVDIFALHLRVFANEVFLAYEAAAKVRPLITTRNIAFGESAKFGAVGNAPALRHRSGIDTWDTTKGFVGNVKFGDQVIFIDDPLRSAEVVGRADEAMGEYDIRGPLARKLGHALAKQDDFEHISMIALGARATAGATDDHGTGAIVASTTLDSDVVKLKAALYEVGILMDDNNVPEEGRFVALRPRQVSMLIEDGHFIDRDFNANVSNGSRAARGLRLVNGMMLIKSTNIPNSVVSDTTVAGASGGATRQDYGGDFSDTVGVAGQMDCIGNVMLRGVFTGVEESLARGADLLVTEVLNGKGVLREDSCFELSKAAINPGSGSFVTV